MSYTLQLWSKPADWPEEPDLQVPLAVRARRGGRHRLGRARQHPCPLCGRLHRQFGQAPPPVIWLGLRMS